MPACVRKSISIPSHVAEAMAKEVDGVMFTTESQFYTYIIQLGYSQYAEVRQSGGVDKLYPKLVITAGAPSTKRGRPRKSASS